MCHRSNFEPLASDLHDMIEGFALGVAAKSKVRSLQRVAGQGNLQAALVPTNIAGDGERIRCNVGEKSKACATPSCTRIMEIR